MNVKLAWGTSSRDHIMGYIFLLITMLLFSTIEVAVKYLVGTLPPLRLASIRFVATGLLLLPMAVARTRARRIPWDYRHALTLVMLGLIGVTFALSFYHAALCFLPASVGAVVFSANPIFVALFAVLLGEERIRARTVGAVILGVVGVGVLAWNRGTFSRGWLAGMLFMSIAQAAFAYYSVLARRFMPRYGAMTLMSVASLIGGTALGLLSRAIEGSFVINLSARQWAILFYLVVGATAVPYVFFFHGLVRVGAARGSTFFFLKPILAPFFAWWFLDESLGVGLIVGAALVVAGLITEIWPSEPSAPPG